MRYSGQHGRKAFGPKRNATQQALAQHIAESIRAHAARGTVRTVEQYSTNVETIEMVNALLRG